MTDARKAYKRYYRTTNTYKQWKKEYYAKSAYAENHMDQWTEAEINMVLEHSIPDRDLAEKIGRSVAAIHSKRSLLKKEAKHENTDI